MSGIDAAHEIVLRRGWLSQTPQAFQRVVLDKCYLQEFKAGTTIYMTGDPPGGMFGLVTGDLGVSIAPGERGPYLAHFFRPGTWFGEAPAFTDQPRRIGVVATRETELLHLPLQAIREIVSGDPQAWRLLALVSVGHLDTIIGGCLDLMICDHVKRFVGTSTSRRLPIGHYAGFCPDRSRRQPGRSRRYGQHNSDYRWCDLANERAGYIELSYRRIRMLAPTP